MYKIAKDGYGIIVKIGLLLLVLILMLIRPDFLPVIIMSGIVLVSVLLAFSFYFLRDPERKTPVGNDLIISPADGVIIKIEKVVDHDYRNEESLLVSVFMNVFNVHVNRYPQNGKVEFIKYIPGKFLAAWDDKASTDNEQAIIGLNCDGIKITVKQIAGLIARRIVYKSKPGDLATTGERFGLIKFGSRVDLYLPVDAVIDVKIGEKVKAGETVIGKIIIQ